MRHSSIFQRLMEQPLTEARQEARQEGIELGIEQGREEGIELGREQGIELGEQKRAAAALIEVLEVRFNEQEVHLFKPTFEALTDLQLLSQLHRTALRAPTFDDVMQTLRGYRNNGA